MLRTKAIPTLDKCRGLGELKAQLIDAVCELELEELCEDEMLAQLSHETKDIIVTGARATSPELVTWTHLR